MNPHTKQLTRHKFLRKVVQVTAASSVALILAAHAKQTTTKQTTTPHIAYVYPAGGKAGSTFEVVVGGQFLTGVTNVFISGDGVHAHVSDYIRLMTFPEIDALQIQIDELTARRAVVRNNFKSLGKFGSSKNTKNSKPDAAEEAEKIEALKKKYANATWTAEDEKLLAEMQKKYLVSFPRAENPALSEIIVLQVTIAQDAGQGDCEIRLAVDQGLTNPLLFKIGQLPEFTKPAVKTIKQKTAVKATQTSMQQFKVAKERVENKVTIPAVINGQILPGTVDYFRFSATKGTHLVFAVSARELIPYLADAVPGWFQATLALYDASGKELAYDDDFRFNPDPVFYYETPADGDYVLEIKDSIYRGREDFVYRITVGEIPFITSIYPIGGPVGSTATLELKGWNLPTTKVNLDNQKRAPGIVPIFVRKDNWISNFVPFLVDNLPEVTEQQNNGQRRTAQAVKLPLIINGRIEKSGDKDYFKFEGQAGQPFVAEVMARRLNSPLDSIITLTDADGKGIASNDDFEDKGTGLETHHADSYLRLTLPKNGTYYLEITDTTHQGGPEYAYRLRLSAPRLDFALRVVPSSINLRAGGTVPVTVYTVRHDGFTNAISIALKDAPEGFRVSDNTIPAGQDSVKLTLTAQGPTSKGPIHLNFVGHAAIGGADIVRSAVPAEDMMQAFFYRHLVPSKELDVATVKSGFGGGKYSGSGSGPRKLPDVKAVSKLPVKLPELKIASELPVKIPAGSFASVKLSGPRYLMTGNRLNLELTDPPEGIRIQKFVTAASGIELFFAADTEKCKAGQKGNLIVTGNVKPKDKGTQRGYKLAPLPEIPYEVVKP